jgi:pSer/pThr/pTyr-binding forkhead associated (FHA) protein
MKKRAPFTTDLGLICIIFLAGVFVIPGSPVSSGGRSEQVVLIQDALKTGQVDAWAEAVGMGFRQPMMLLHVAEQNEIAITIRIPIGTRIVSSDPQFSDLVVASTVEALPAPEAAVLISTFSLSYNLSLPSATEISTYKIDEVVTGKLAGLLKTIDEQHGYERFGAQLAVWSLYPDPEVPIDQMTGKIQTKPEDIQDAAHWLRLAQTREPAGRPKLGTFLIAILVMAAVIAAWITWRDTAVLKRSTPMKPNTSEKPVQPSGSFLESGMEKKKNPPLKAEKAAVKNTEIHPGASSHQPVQMTGISGKLGGKNFNLELPCLISRGEVEWLVLEDGSVSTPHALFDFSIVPFRVKDLNSRNGLRLGEQRVEQYTDVYLGDKLSIGTQTLLVKHDGLNIIGGSMAGHILAFTSELVGLTREKFNVLILGTDDMRISDAHAILYEDNGKVIIRDLHRSNGSCVNGQRIMEETPLKNGDHLLFGNSEFEVLIPPLVS